jgi:hypothetical protein
MVLARTVARESTGMLQDKPLKNPARSAAEGSTGWEQDGPVKHTARAAARASTEMLQDKPLKYWKIWSRSSLVLKDLLVGTELILFCGPRYFGIFRERTRLCVDGEDGIR